LLPEDPDASAERLQKELCARLGLSRLGVVITDTFGRPWRQGLVNVAIGCAGFPALVDLRGTKDSAGRVLEATVEALADEVAAATGLVMGKADGIPAAVVRGVHAEGTPLPASALVRPPEEDLFRESTLQALTSWSQATTFRPDEVEPDLVREALLAAGGSVRTGDEQSWILVEVARGPARAQLAETATVEAAELISTAPVVIVGLAGSPASPGGGQRSQPSWDGALLSAGAAIQNLMLAFHAVGLACRWIPGSSFRGDEAGEAIGIGARRVLIGAVAAGHASASR
jgi:coenzyme F420-0:L-glutamate ligase / coenzyme F420-1:gamma-L-glutamate ligase